MATNFPNSLDSLTNPVSTDQLNSPSHSDQHINANDAIEALQAKVGTDNSAVTTSHDYRIRQLELNPVTSTANKIEQVVVNGASETTLLKGQVVYASGSVGASGKLRVTLSSNSAESTSSKTFGILAENIIPGGEGLLVSEGLLEGIDTTGANDGDPIWLGSTPGSLIFGLINKPVAPSHLVFLGIVVRGGQQNTGSIFVKIQNGFEIEELHNILITDVQDKDALIYDDSTGLWKNYDLTQDFVSSSDVQNSLGDYIPLTALGQPSGPAELNPDGDLLIPQDKIIFEGATADDHELTLQSPDVTSDIIVTLPNSTGTIALTSEIPSLTGYATETYADTAASNAQSAAETYADGLAVNYDPAGSASTAEGNANSYTDTQLLSYTPTSSLDSTVDGYGYLKSTDLSGYATETYVDTAVSDLVSSAPETLDTLNELAAALGDDPNYATTITTALGDKVSKSGGDIITSSLPSVIGLTIKGAASQTADLQQWQNSSGTVLAKVASDGLFKVFNGTNLSRTFFLPDGATDATTHSYAYFNTASGGQGIYAKNLVPTVVPLTIMGYASQTANLQEWQNSSGTVLASISSNGTVYMGSTGSANIATFYNGTSGYGAGNISYNGTFNINGANIGFPYTSSGAVLAVNATNAGVVPLTSRAYASQTADLQQWQNSSGTVLAKVDASGRLVVGNTTGTIQVTSSGTSGSYPSSGAGIELIAGSSSGTDLIQAYNRNSSSWRKLAIQSAGLLAKSVYTTNVPLTIQGISSQTANLQEWRDGTNTLLAKVDASGAMFTTTAAVGTDTDQVATTAFVIDQIDASTQPGSLYQADAPTSPEVGQIWIESDSYSDSFDPNIIRRQSFTATLGQTIFTTAVSFIEGYEQVYFNGLLLLRTTDYTTSGGNTVTLIEAAAADDIIEVVTITNLNSVNTYTQAEIDAKIALEVNNLVASAPSTLNTLDELAAALNDDANFASTVTTSLAGKKNETSSSISSNANLVAGTRYFVTSASALTLTLPSTPSVNDQIDIFDASGNASTYNITVARNGNLINGNAGNLIIDVNGGWFTLVFTGNTYGWKVA